MHTCVHMDVCVWRVGDGGVVLGSTFQIQKEDSAFVFTMNGGKSSEPIKARTGVCKVRSDNGV